MESKQSLIGTIPALKKSYSLLIQNRALGYVTKLAMVLGSFVMAIGVVVMVFVFILGVVSGIKSNGYTESEFPTPTGQFEAAARVLGEMTSNEEADIFLTDVDLYPTTGAPVQDWDSNYWDAEEYDYYSDDYIQEPISAISIVAIILFYIAIFSFGIFSLTLMTQVILDIGKSEYKRVKDLFKIALRKTLPMLGLYFVIILGTLLGYLFLIIPGIIFAIATIFSHFILMEHNEKPVSALKKGLQLTKGYRLSIFVRLLVFTLIGTLFSLPMIILMYAGGIVFSFLFSTFSQIFLYVIYEDLKSIKSHTPSLETTSIAP